ncbi:MAG: ribonuclease III [Prevotellaceae bacterium]|nr:ribonuclease III [Prevotellaceae bacterium]
MFTVFYEIRLKIIYWLSKDKEFRRTLKTILKVYPVNTIYYKCAFTHRSAVKNKNGHNERLEYLGDALISAIVAEYLYKKYPEHEEGNLTKMRSKLVNRLSLLKIGKNMGLDRLLVSNINTETEGKYIISNVVEALVGAVYLDFGYRYARYFVLNILLCDLLNSDIEQIEYDFKSKMLEWGQKYKKTISFESKQNRDSTFSSDILIEGNVVGKGIGYTKKESEQNASKNVWEIIKSRDEV